MRFLSITIFILCINSGVIAQYTVSGQIKDKKTNNNLHGATVIVDNSFSAVSDEHEGAFQFNNLTASQHSINVRYLGYEQLDMSFNLTGDTTITIHLEKKFYYKDEIVISATRANEKYAMAYTNIEKTEIENINTGRDIPYLLESVPSLVATSDAGNGIGYTGVRIRGSDASRINVTINGIPINDSESQLLYWVNMPDLASSIDNIQVQRGVGTSTNGASAFGGSINIQTENKNIKPFLTTSGSYGSFNTFKSNAIIGTGMINDKWNFEGRLSKITSDGYVDRASSDLKSFFISGGYYGKKDQFKLNIFSGKEVTYQSWYGIPEAALDTNRTWNYYTYENQVDNYQQDHYQLFYTHEFSSKLLLNTAIHYTYGRGYYEEYEEGELLADYGLDNIIISADTITNTDLIRRKWLDNDFYGATWSLFYNPDSKTNFIVGGAYNEYDGDHFGKVIWAQYASNSTVDQKYYNDNGFKTDFNIYAKATFEVVKNFSVLADVQYRRISYEFTGPDITLLPVDQKVELNFFNPKAGLTYNFNKRSYAYLSCSVGNKEPSRDDYTSTTSNSRPMEEQLYDFESGYQYKSKNLTFGINFYLMLYKNQLVLTGEINDVGNYTRTNVDKSYREGVEFNFAYEPIKQISVQGNLTMSKNIISEYNDYIDDYDNGGQIVTTYKNTDIAFSPDLTAFAGITGILGKQINLTLTGRYVGKQYLDNTTSEQKTIDPYFVNDLRLNYTIKPKFMKEIILSGSINNIFDVAYESNGYTFGYIYGGEKIRENYYYPQAGTNFSVMATLKF